MSFGKARQRQESAPSSGGFDNSLMCRMPGCTLRWSVDISHGRVCSFHDESLSRRGMRTATTQKTVAGPVPLAQEIPHWSDPSDADEHQ